MANEPLPPDPPDAVPDGAGTTQLNLRGAGSVVVYRHSTLFYWWPVWFFGFLFAAITYFGDYHMAIVPAGTTAAKDVAFAHDDNSSPAKRNAFVLPEGKKHLTRKNDAGEDEVIPPTIFVSRYRSLGAIYIFILLLVIFITNITLRGQWSVIVLIVLIAAVIILQLSHQWERIFERLGHLSIYINLGGYLMLSLVVFGLWLFNFFLFDRQLYVVFTPGQVRLCLEIGTGETIFDSFGMTVQKTRSDLFRHKILGFGSGDIVLRFARQQQPIEMHNVLNVRSVLKRIEQLTKEKMVVTSRDKATPTPGGPNSPPNA